MLFAHGTQKLLGWIGQAPAARPYRTTTTLSPRWTQL